MSTPAASADDDPALRRLLDRVTVLGDRPRLVTPLAGGLTNRNYRVDTAAGSYVVRISAPDTTALAIDRDHEYRNSVIAAASGVGAPVIDYLPDDHLLVVAYLDGATLRDADLARPEVITRVAAACRRLHDGPGFGNDFDMFAVQRGYLTLVRERGYRLPDGYLDFAEHLTRIRAAFAVNATAPVACNNDLLAANFIDDGERIHIIDYEYAGNNDACFELGNIWSECHLDKDQLVALVRAYYGHVARNKIARAMLQGLMSKYGWTLWASIQQATSEIDFDFWAWGMEKYESAVGMFRGPRFETLLAEVCRPD